MKRATFTAVLEAGHKGAAVIVPFDPELEWEIEAEPVVSEEYGVRPGYLVRATIAGHAFDGWIGNRWGRYFVIVDETAQRAAGVAPGETVLVTLEPRPARTRASAKRAPAKRRGSKRPASKAAKRKRAGKGPRRRPAS